MILTYNILKHGKTWTEFCPHPACRPHDHIRHAVSPSWTARGRRHSGRTHNTDELLRLLFKDTLPPSDRHPSLPAPPDMCELLQKSREWLVTADCLWYHRVDTETALKHCCWCTSNFCCKMGQYLINVPAGIDSCGPNLDLTVYKSPVEDGVLYIFAKIQQPQVCFCPPSWAYLMIVLWKTIFFLCIYLLGIWFLSGYFQAVSGQTANEPYKHHLFRNIFSLRTDMMKSPDGPPLPPHQHWVASPKCDLALLIKWFSTLNQPFPL